MTCSWIALAGLLLSGGANAAPLRVGVAGTAPFVVGASGAIDGLSVDVFKEVARSAGIEYELRRLPGVAQALEAIDRGEIDVAVGPISITAERTRRHDFTQPDFSATMGILTRAGGGSAWERARPLFSRAFGVGVGVLLLVLSGVGILIWLAERRVNDTHFPATFWRGMGEGMWFALVTMTTVGYGDRVPVTRAGRALAGAWMIIAMLTASSLTAGIATALTLSQMDGGGISGLEELRGRRVAAIRGTTGATLARRYTPRVKMVKDRDTAILRLLDGEADAVVMDAPLLRHWMTEHDSAPVVLIDTHADRQSYGFALGLGSPARKPLSLAILALLETDRVSQLGERWLGGD